MWYGVARRYWTTSRGLIMHPKCTETTFRSNVAAHQLHILVDNGVYRHIQFRRPTTITGQFDLVTWPGYLCFAGDMGNYVFQRTCDMFEFFRGRPDATILTINPRYWAEKICAPDQRYGVTEYDPDKVRQWVLEFLDKPGATPAMREATEYVLQRAEDGEIEGFP